LTYYIGGCAQFQWYYFSGGVDGGRWCDDNDGCGSGNGGGENRNSSLVGLVGLTLPPKMVISTSGGVVVVVPTPVMCLC